MTTLYKKVGRRYRPVAEHEELDSYPAGAHLVVCSPGSTLRRFNIDPDRAGLLAAAEPLRSQIRALVMDLHKMRPTRRPVTMQQAAAWRRFQKAMGGDGVGSMVLDVVATFKPGRFPERVFYTRRWIDPDGREFGKPNKLRVTTAAHFRSLLKGYRHDFEVSE